MSEYSGRTVDEAVAAGLADLGLRREQVRVSIVSEGRRGVMGLGSEDARVEVVALPGTSTPAAAAQFPAQASAAPVASRATQSAPAAPGDAARGVQLLEEALQLMGLEAQVTARAAAADEPNRVTLDITGEGMGLVIGWRGETLNALQTWLNVAVNRGAPPEERLRLVLDAEGYRERREDTLRDMVLRVAERVAETGQAISLEAMQAYERRVVHMALAEHPDVTTFSSGEDPHRYVVVEPRSPHR